MKISKFNEDQILCFSLAGICSMILLLCALTAHSQTAARSDSEPEKEAPLHVVSDKMIAVRPSAMVEFIGNVKATRLDSTVYADSIKVFFNDSSGAETQPRGNVKKIISTGNVRYTAGDRKAFADRAVYTTADQILVLSGESAKLMTGTSFVAGKKITLYQAEDKVIVESDGTNRVEALFNPGDESPDGQ